ncbi:MAG: hypothetical protein HY509_04405 [Acidobacteria bacterium]|nr:hypothetical protein [Acidobacteriota bacterium]
MIPGSAGSLLAFTFLSLVGAGAPGDLPPSGTEGLAVYPSFRPIFDAQTETFALRSTVFVLNTTPKELSQVVFSQTLPSPMGVRLAEFTSAERSRRPEGMQEAVDGQTYRMELPVLRPQEGTLLQNEVTLERRLGSQVFPGLVVAYTVGGEREEIRSADQTYDLTVYADHVGPLERFLRKRCKVSLDLTSGNRKVWEFAGRDSAAIGSNPTGVLGVEVKDEKEGHYRIRSGSPGDLVEILVVWRPVRKRDREVDPPKLVDTLEDFTRWMGNLRFERSTLRLTRLDFLGYQDSYSLTGRWMDQVANRFGGGPFRWIVMYDPKVEVEYLLLLMAQGRGLGPEAAATPQPEKEAELMEELDLHARTFQSGIVPVSRR